MSFSRASAILIAMVSFFPLPAAAQGENESCLLRVESDPPGAFLSFNGADSVLHCPADTSLAAGFYRVEASKAGHQILVYEFNLQSGDTLSLNFLLLSQRPVMPAPEDLGLSYEPIIPLVPETGAQKVQEKYNVLAETFAIIPLSQGIMSYLALGGGNDYFSGELVAAGIVLSVGSYVLGRVMASRKLDEIRVQNEVLTAKNFASENHNKDVDRRVRQVHAEAIQRWQTEASWRGRVVIPD